jgi:deazaflavin-dependent oxidoreductase (nitroreductase family)
MDDDLVATGRYARLVTRGRRTGLPRTVTVGFVEEAGGSILVAARAGSDWGANLLGDPLCRVTVGDRSWSALAEPLERGAFAAAIRELILRYGTPAEKLGAGPAFRLAPATDIEENP